MQTRGEQMQALRRARMAAAWPIFRGGFRPFFVAAAAWAIFALGVWLWVLGGDGPAWPSAFDPLAWHRHEMLFGFVGAVVSGYLLTTIPNWTGRLPIAGRPLAMLLAGWATARLAVLGSAFVGAGAALFLDAGFYLVLAGLALREVRASKLRNLPLVLMVMAFGIANALDHAALLAPGIGADIGWRAGIGLMVLMISLVGGRIVPSFTRNWLTRHGIKNHLPGQPGRFDMLVMGVSGIALAAWVLIPGVRPVGWLLGLAALFQTLRLARWGGWRAARDPMVLVLHIGFAWIPVGLALLGAAEAGLGVVRSAAIHALTAGAMATMILAVMTRTILAQTGRLPVANLATTGLFLLVTMGAVLRVLAACGLVATWPGLMIAGGLWSGAFMLFLIVYAPIVFASRPAESAGKNTAQ